MTNIYLTFKFLYDGRIHTEDPLCKLGEAFFNVDTDIEASSPLPLPPTFNCQKSYTTFWYQACSSQWPRGAEQLSYLGTDELQSNIRLKQTETRWTSWAHT